MLEHDLTDVPLREPVQIGDCRLRTRRSVVVRGRNGTRSLGTNAILYAFDAETGKELFRSELDSFNHFTNPVVAGGAVNAVTWDGKLYAFSLSKR